MEGQTEDFTPRGYETKLTPGGQHRPWGKSSPLRVKFRIGLWPQGIVNECFFSVFEINEYNRDPQTLYEAAAALASWNQCYDANF
jgi:hypothetical protein